MSEIRIEQRRTWRDDIVSNPAILAPLVALIATIGMNAHTGYMLGNRSELFALVLVGVAGMTAYAGYHGMTMAWSPRRAGLIGWLIIGLAIDQLCAWQTFSVMFADGQVARESKSTGVSSIAEQIKALRAERAKLGSMRPVASIEADERLECGKISRSFPDGVGPKCTDYRKELGQAKRVVDIDAKLPGLVDGLETHEQVAGGQVQFDVPLRVTRNVVAYWDGPKAAQKVSADDVLFGLLLLLSAVLGLLANFGFWLVGAHAIGGDDAPCVERGPLRRLPAPVKLKALPGAVDVDPDGAVTFGGRSPDGGCGGASAAHAPTTIHVYGGAAAQQAAGAPAAAEASVFQQAQSSLAGAKTQLEPRTRHDLDALSGHAPPVDRSGVRFELSPAEREASDVILAFRAACLADAPGAVVAVDDLYQRYAAWAGARAVAREAFVMLLRAVTTIEVAIIAGAEHARNVMLRSAKLNRVG